jgi:hypothetical protein
MRTRTDDLGCSRRCDACPWMGARGCTNAGTLPHCPACDVNHHGCPGDLCTACNAAAHVEYGPSDDSYGRPCAD